MKKSVGKYWISYLFCEFQTGPETRLKNGE